MNTDRPGNPWFSNTIKWWTMFLNARLLHHLRKVDLQWGMLIQTSEGKRVGWKSLVHVQLRLHTSAFSCAVSITTIASSLRDFRLPRDQNWREVEIVPWLNNRGKDAGGLKSWSTVTVCLFFYTNTTTSFQHMACGYRAQLFLNVSWTAFHS